MLIVANRKNLKKYARNLLGNEYSPERERALIKACLFGFERFPGHISHGQAAHLGKIDKILGTCGVEGSESPDVLYCNAGDTYALTILYWGGKLLIGEWASIVEKAGL